MRQSTLQRTKLEREKERERDKQGGTERKGGSEEREEREMEGGKLLGNSQPRASVGECFPAFGLHLLRAYPLLSSMPNARFVMMQHENKSSNGAAPCSQQDVEITGSSGNGKEGTKSVDTPSRKVRRKNFFFCVHDYSICVPDPLQLVVTGTS